VRNTKLRKRKEITAGNGGEKATEPEEHIPLNFMDLIPERVKEHIKEDWQIGFKLPRFRSRIWSWFFIHLGATKDYIVRLDRMGSEIWGYIDDERTVRSILVRLELSHPKEEDLRDRLIHYLKRLKYHEFIELKTSEEKEETATGENKKD